MLLLLPVNNAVLPSALSGSFRLAPLMLCIALLLTFIAHFQEIGKNNCIIVMEQNSVADLQNIVIACVS